MESKPPKPAHPITNSRIVLVEGQDEVVFFTKLINYLELSDIEVRQVGGSRAKMRSSLKALLQISGHELITSLSVVRDADNDAAAAFQSACDALRAVDLEVPPKPMVTVGRDPRVTVMILPPGRGSGTLEDVCLASIEDDPAMKCVNEYFHCLAETLEELPTTLSKGIVRAFLVSRELLQDAHFQFLQGHIEGWMPTMPPHLSSERVHAFLASRFKPTLDLGVAAELGYWNLDHVSFEPIKDFLTRL